MDKFQWLGEMNRRFTLLQECHAKVVELAMTNQDADFLISIRTVVNQEIAQMENTVSFIDRVVVVPKKRARTK